jgi:hypothetical protein
MAGAAGRRWAVERFLRGGASLKTQYLDNEGISEGRGEFGMPYQPGRRGLLDRLLAAARWNAVVMQGQSMDAVETPEDFLRFGARLAEKIRGAGVKRIVLYETWARQDRPDQQGIITMGYRALAKAIRAEIAPVGQAWQRALSDRSGLIFHAADKSHPTPLGSYLAACVLCGRLSRRSPVGLRHDLAEVRDGNTGEPCYHDLDADTAAFLQTAADAVLSPRRG